MLIKASTPPAVLCRDMPYEFTKIMEYIIEIEGHSDPDYVYIESLFEKAADRNGFKIDWDFKWEEPRKKQIPQNTKSEGRLMRNSSQ